MEITQVAKARKMVEIDFNRYSEKFDEWKQWDELYQLASQYD